MQAPPSAASCTKVNFDATWESSERAVRTVQRALEPAKKLGLLTRRAGRQFLAVEPFCGYRFPRRQAQISVGILNLTDGNYRLEPLTPYNELAAAAPSWPRPVLVSNRQS